MPDLPKPFPLASYYPDLKFSPSWVKHSKWREYAGYHISYKHMDDPSDYKKYDNYEWLKLMVFDFTGSPHSETWVYVPVAAYTDKYFIWVNSNGIVEIKYPKALTFWDHLKIAGFLTIKGFTAILGISVALDIPMENLEISHVTGWLADKYTELKEKAQPVIDAYQKSMAVINTALHIDLLAKIHTIGQIMIPEYRNFWKAQEAELASYSQRVFGTTGTMSNYVHVAELYFAIQIKNTDKSEEEKRYASLVHSAAITKRIKRKIKTFENNPLSVYGDILYYTFGEGNKFIDKHGIYEGADVFKQLEGAGIKITEWRDKLNDLRLFDVALDKINLSIIDEQLEKTLSKLDTMYQSELKPTFRIIQKIVDKQQKAIAELETSINRHNETMEKARIMTTNPADLTEDERAFQNNTFIKQFDSAIPGVNDRFKFKTYDIKEFLDE